VDHGMEAAGGPPALGGIRDGWAGEDEGYGAFGYPLPAARVHPAQASPPQVAPDIVPTGRYK